MTRPTLLFWGGLAIAASALLFSMLGQLDIILSPWYCDPSKTWEFPFPFIFNRVVSSLLGWEIIYALIIVAFACVFIAGYGLGAREIKKT